MFRLPYELRVQIWDLCLKPQVVDIWTVYGPYPVPAPSSNQEQKFIVRTHSSTRAPLHQICHESRQFARDHSCVLLPTALHLTLGTRNPALQLFNLQADVLHFCRAPPTTRYISVGFFESTPQILARLSPEITKHIRYIAIGHDAWLACAEKEDWLWLLAFESLQEVVIVGKLFPLIWSLRTIKNTFKRLKVKHPTLVMPTWKFVETREELEEATQQGRLGELWTGEQALIEVLDDTTIKDEL